MYDRSEQDVQEKTLRQPRGCKTDGGQDVLGDTDPVQRSGENYTISRSECNPYSAPWCITTSTLQRLLAGSPDAEPRRCQASAMWLCLFFSIAPVLG